MTAINANMSNSQDWLPLSEADAVAIAPGFYTIGSESIEIQGLHRAATLTTSPFNGRWCARAIAGSSAASHTSGASLTRYYPDAPATGGGGSISATDGTTTVNPMTSLRLPAGTLADLGSGVGGIVRSVISIGPIARRFDTPDIADFGAVAAVADLPAGSWLISTWAIVRDAFDDGSGDSVAALRIIVRSAADPTNGTLAATAVTYAVGGSDPSEVSRDVSTAPAEFPQVLYSFPVVAQGDCELIADLSVSGNGHEALTQGEADIYAIVASPAS